jgi:hypothetical protein
MTERVLCSKCSADDVLCYMTAETAICPACCDDHDYVSEAGEVYCEHCGSEPPADYYACDDDVGFSNYRLPSEPVGIPASAMNGNASARGQYPDAWARWVAFSEACGAP